MTHDELEAWFNDAPEGQKAALRELRGTIKSLHPDIVEEFKWGRPCYSAMRGLFCYLQTTKNHVSLGFYHGASLADPHRLLQGAGKDMRHIKLGPASGTSHEALLDILRQAWRNAS